MPLETKKWRTFLVDFAKEIGKPDPENYVDVGNDVKIRFTNCTTEEHARIYRLVRPFSDELVNLFVPFGKIAPELGSKLLREMLVLDFKKNVPILSIMPFKQGTAVKIKTLNVADHDELNAELGKFSRILNRRADMLGIVYDEKFRNLNGMKCIFQNVRYHATNGRRGLSSVGK